MKLGTFRIYPGSLKSDYKSGLVRAEKEELMGRMMSRRPEVFSTKRDIQKTIGNRLGWVDTATVMKRRIKSIESFGGKVFKDGLNHIVLCGMGGSSLSPEVFSLMFGAHKRVKSFSVLDSTDPEAVRTVLRRIDLKRTLFIVASKSGGTVETRCQEAFFISKVKEAGITKWGSRFAAITDPGSSLEAFAKEQKYRKVFLNQPDIGGRYSALSYFGLVPGFFAGVDLGQILDAAVSMQGALAERGDESNPALALGTILAAASRAGRNKLTFLTTKKIAPLVPWIEQLVAESTGKKKKGIIPIEAEPAFLRRQYGDDRIFVVMSMAGERRPKEYSFIDSFREDNVPVIEISLKDNRQLGAHMLLWEAATAVAGYHLRINPFDEPNVTESKNNTGKLLAVTESNGDLPFPEPVAKFGPLTVISTGGDRVFRPADRKNLTALLKRFLTGLKVPEYVSLLGYFKSDKQTENAFEQARRAVTSKRTVVTLRGYGPRFLHSIGQLYKGGPPIGRFIVFIRSDYSHLDIEGKPFDFGTLISAQALGDSQALIRRQLPTLVIAIDGKPAEGIGRVARALSSALK